MSEISLADDLIEGADELAEFLFGDRRERRKVYRWASEVDPEHRLPTFRRGAILCGRKSTIFTPHNRAGAPQRRRCRALKPPALTNSLSPAKRWWNPG